jgi:hypothetical protein
MVRRIHRRVVRGRGCIERRDAQDLPNPRDTDGRHPREVFIPSKYEDELTVESTVLEFRRSSFDVRHRVLKNGERSQPIPAEVIARFKDIV